MPNYIVDGKSYFFVDQLSEEEARERKNDVLVPLALRLRQKKEQAIILIQKMKELYKR